MFAAATIIAVAGLMAAHRGWLDNADDDQTPIGAGDARQVGRSSSRSYRFVSGLSRRRTQTSIYQITGDI
jgi:hypothetical protein